MKSRDIGYNFCFINVTNIRISRKQIFYSFKRNINLGIIIQVFLTENIENIEIHYVTLGELYEPIIVNGVIP